uniref:Uncharacterized protein n=1 Tax=Anguilla anguilla TaxID=7936 RepID=A0A0E9STN9_ANGAN
MPYEPILKGTGSRLNTLKILLRREHCQNSFSDPTSSTQKFCHGTDTS